MELTGKTDWEAVVSMTEEEIIAAATLDEDAPLLTEDELKQFKRVKEKKNEDNIQ